MAGSGAGQPRPTVPPKEGMMIIDNIEELIRLDKEIDTVEEQSDENLRQAHRARWEFGRLMLAARVEGGRGRGTGAKLPVGYLDELAERTGRSQSDLKQRMWFATSCPTEDELVNVLTNSDGSCKRWYEVLKVLPKPKPEPKPQPRPSAQRDAQIAALKEQGRTRDEIAEEIGINPRSVDNALRANRAVREAEETLREEALAESIDYASAPLTAQAKVDGMVRRRTRELEKALRTQLRAEADQFRAECEVNVAAYKAKLDAENQVMRGLRDDERRRYQEGIEVYRAKGLITPDEYNTIRSCLHPDSRMSVTDEKLAAAFRLFNDPRIKTLLVKEIKR